MGYEERKIIIEKIEKERKSKVVTLITSDRYSTFPIQGIQAQIAPDQINKIISHLKEMCPNKCEKIDLFIYSRGGDTNTAWPLVNNIRNYCKEFNVLVPMHAHSAATLIALGANKIIMTKNGSLSPIDPTVANAFNPKENNMPLGISVEDVASFISLAKDKEVVGIENEDNVTKVFQILANKVHPLALGNVKRSHSQIRLLTRKLLGLHFDNGNSTEKVTKIVDELTERLYTHNHSIFRDEARNSIGLDGIVIDAAENEEKLFWELYSEYEKEMKLKEFFDPNVFLGDQNEKLLDTSPVFIESMYNSSKLNFKQKILRTFIQDQNFRLQIIQHSGQNGQALKTLKAQLLQIQANINNLRAQIANILNTNPTNPILMGIEQSYAGIEKNFNDIIKSLPNELDLSLVKKNIEFVLEYIGWIN